MTKEFNLSEKEKNMPVETDWERTGETDYEPVKWEYKPFYSEEDVKEFIRLLKEKILYRHQGFHSSVSDVCNEEIDKLAGEKLISDLDEDGYSYNQSKMGFDA